MLSQFRLLLSHLLVPRVGGVGCGGGSGGCLEAVAAFVLRRRFLHGLGLIWIGFPFEMMTTGIGEGGSQGEREREGGVLAIRDSHARCGDASEGLKMSEIPPKYQ